MYLPDGTELMMNHVYVKAGKYGSYDDIFQGGLDTDTEGHSLLTIRMDGIWAFSTQYYKGENV